MLADVRWKADPREHIPALERRLVRWCACVWSGATVVGPIGRCVATNERHRMLFCLASMCESSPQYSPPRDRVTLKMLDAPTDCSRHFI